MKHNIGHYLLTFLYLLFKSILSAFIWILLAGVGLLVFQSKKSPLDLIIGLPLLILAGGMFLNSVHTAFLALFSPKYNQSFCPLCVKS